MIKAGFRTSLARQAWRQSTWQHSAAMQLGWRADASAQSGAAAFGQAAGSPVAQRIQMSDRVRQVFTHIRSERDLFENLRRIMPSHSNVRKDKCCLPFLAGSLLWSSIRTNQSPQTPPRASRGWT